MKRIRIWMMSTLLAAGLAMEANATSKNNDNKLIIPSPKNMEIGKEVMMLSNNAKALAKIILPTDASAIERQAANYFNETIKNAGGSTLPILEDDGKATPGNHIFIGINTKFQHHPLQNNELEKYPLGEQGYLIRCSSGKTVLTGLNERGVLYAAVTAGFLLETHGNNIVLRTATVSDWPDFHNRMLLNDILSTPVREGKVMPNEGHGNLEVAKRQIDWALRYKFNLIQVDALMFKEYLDCEDDWEWIRQINNYASKRGIKILFHDYHGWAVGKVKRNGDTQLYKEGVNIFQKHYYTWSRNDLLEKKAEQLRRFVSATGTMAVGLHAQDYWDGNWINRSKACKETFGDDRAAGDANIINILYRGLKAGNPDIMVNMIPFPYARNLDLPGNEDVREYYRRLSAAIPADIWLTCAGYSGEAVDSWHRNLRQPLLLWINNIPFGYGCFFDWTPRFSRSIYREAHTDDIIFLNHPYSFFDTLPVSLIGIEYQWNTKAPGYGVVTESEVIVKDGPYYTRLLNFEDKPLAEWVLEHGQDLPHPDSAGFLQRICASLYGNNIGEGMAEMLLCGVTDWPLPDWRWMYKRNETLDVITNELNKSEKALKILENMRDENLEVEEKNTVNRFYNRIYHRTLYLRAKHLVASATDAAAKHDLTTATKLAEEAERLIDANLKKLNDRVHTRWLYYLNTDSWYKKLKQDIYFLRLKLRFSNQDSVKSGTKIAIYKPNNRGGQVFPFQTIYNTLIRNSEFNVEFIDNLQEQTLNKFKVLIIPQVKSWGKGDRELYRSSIRKFVSAGGGAYFEHDANGWTRPGRDAIDRGVFPEICIGISDREPEHPGKELQVKVNLPHPALGNSTAKSSFPQMYWDYNILTPGPNGKVLARSESGKPTLIAGSFGKGRVLCNGMVTLKSNDQDAEEAFGIDKLIINHGVSWLSGK
ncbi:MAG: hypothetical protein JXR78_11190 [Victivallales bacterium]|nr:hypothetical protein [Victivallales bacterium]